MAQKTNKKFLTSILQAKMECDNCGWAGMVCETEDVDDPDGRMGCPRCHSIVHEVKQ